MSGDILYGKCMHYVFGDPPVDELTMWHIFEYCPDCHRKLMDAEVEQRERVERERCVCCGSYIGGDLCEQP